MRKLILRCGLSPGDIVMLTAAVRDLHHCHPGEFLTDVRTVCAGLWENNPHVTALSEDDPGVEQIECSYPLINQSNQAPYHCLHGFVEFLNDRLNLRIKPTAFHGDIHLSAQEKAWHSQVHEVTGAIIPYWLIAAGGKHDLTIKWWQSERYQEVVHYFRGKIQFVQVGQLGHHHPKLDGVIDLRAKTNLRELVRLVHHAEGVLCSVTSLMHLAAAVETRRGQPPRRPCVVVAGGREPPNWEAYPHHQFIHTIGALPCCAAGGCWKDRTVRLRDGNHRDRAGNLCIDVVNGLPHCMEMIKPAEVIRRIEGYFAGGQIKYLSAGQRKAAERGVAATAENPFDQHPLSLASAGMACDRFVASIPSYPDCYRGRGIVICGGGIRYFVNAWVCLRMLRRLGCQLPVQVWSLGEKEMDAQMKALLAPLGVECVDATKVRRKHPARIRRGWELKPYAILHSPFREVLLLDADNVPVVNPEFLFATPEFHATGAIFWPDFVRQKTPEARAVWRSCGLRTPGEPEFESGQIVVDKSRCWEALRLSMWFNENSEFYYRHVYGDKETFHMAFRRMKKSYSLVPEPIHPLPGTMCQHDFMGRRIFQHRNTAKWDLFFNRRIKDFWFEKECRDDVAELGRVWDGRMTPEMKLAAPSRPKPTSRPMKIEAVMISCAERDKRRNQTLKNLRKTDWGNTPIHVHMDTADGGKPVERQTHASYLALKKSLDYPADYILFLEDDLVFNRHIRHNLRHWAPLKSQMVTLAGLYNPRLPERACDFLRNARIIDPNSIYGSQALLLSRETVEHVVGHWEDEVRAQDIRISRLAGQLKKPIYYHAPSLVQHVGRRSTWGGGFHQAADFDPTWKAAFSR